MESLSDLQWFSSLPWPPNSQGSSDIMWFYVLPVSPWRLSSLPALLPEQHRQGFWQARLQISNTAVKGGEMGLVPKTGRTL